MAKSSSKPGRSAGKGGSKGSARRTVKRPAGARRVEPPSLKRARARVYAKPDFFASLMPEQRAAFDAYEGPEVSGGPGPIVQRVDRAAQ